MTPKKVRTKVILRKSLFGSPKLKKTSQSPPSTIRCQVTKANSTREVFKRFKMRYFRILLHWRLSRGRRKMGPRYSFVALQALRGLQLLSLLT